MSHRRTSGRFTSSHEDMDDFVQFPIMTDCRFDNPALFCYQNSLLHALFRTCLPLSQSLLSLSASVDPLILALRNTLCKMADPDSGSLPPPLAAVDLQDSRWDGHSYQDITEFMESLFHKLAVAGVDLSPVTGECAVVASCPCGAVDENIHSSRFLWCDTPKGSLQSTVSTTLQAVNILAPSECRICGSIQAATQKTSYISLPDFLIAIINRRTSGSSQRNTGRVLLSNTFSVSDHSGHSVDYAPCAVVEFNGANSNFGHYKAKVQATNGSWKCYDDSRIENNSEPEPKNSYLIVSKKVSFTDNRLPKALFTPPQSAQDVEQQAFLSIPSGQDSSSGPAARSIAPLPVQREDAQQIQAQQPLRRSTRARVPPQKYSNGDFIRLPEKRRRDPDQRVQQDQIQHSKPVLPKRPPKCSGSTRPIKLGPSVIDILETKEFSDMLPLYQSAIESIVSSGEVCPVCQEVRPNLEIAPLKSRESSRFAYAAACRRCRDHFTKNPGLPFKFSAENNMMPSVIPEELSGLTTVEQAMISLISPVMAVFTLRHGASCARGHVVAIPVDLDELANSVISLPRPSLNVVVITRQMFDGTHREFRVRRDIVCRALRWLKAHNEFFKDLVIDEVTLSQLPEDGPYDKLNIVYDSDIGQIPLDAGPDAEIPADLLSSSFIPNVIETVLEKERIRNSLTRAPTKVLSFKSHRGFFTKAFPCLFPDGRGDISISEKLFHQVSVHDYLAHLLLLRDQRFANDRRFPYFLFNVYMRERVSGAADIFVKRSGALENLSVGDLRAALQAHIDGSGNMTDHQGVDLESLVHSASAWTRSLKGTSPYWKSAKRKLIPMIRQLGHPHLFCTHSFADFHCADLRAFLSNRLGFVVTESSQKAVVLANPGLVDSFLYQKFKVLFDKFYVGILGVSDYYIRIEYQGRGAIHVHMLAWIQGLEMSSLDAIKNIADTLISTNHPDLGYDHAGNPNPCKRMIDYSTIISKDSTAAKKFITEIVTHVQRHRCTPGYCDNRQGHCRFNFPKELAAETSVSEEDGKIVIKTARNDPFLNNFCPALALLCRANHDIQIITSISAAIAYVAKYTTKSEISTASVRELARTCAQKCSESDSVLKFVKMVMNMSLIDRDYSQQEVIHIATGLPLFEFSRSFVSINSSDSVKLGCDGSDVPSSLDIYVERGNFLSPDTALADDVMSRSMWGLNQNYYQSGRAKVWTRVPIKRIVLRTPHFPKLLNGSINEEWCKAHLITHKVYRTKSDILGEHSNYVDAYNDWKELPANHPAKDPDYSQDICDDSLISLEIKKNRESKEQEMESSPNDGIVERKRVVHDAGEVSSLLPETPLGPSFNPRVAAIEFDPHAYSESSSFMNSVIKRGSSSDSDAMGFARADPEKLTAKQKIVFDRVQVHLQNSASDKRPLRILVHGTAGTGKSFLIDCLVGHLGSKCRKLAPTGVAANNINGSTIHSAVCLPAKGNDDNINSNKLKTLQSRFEGVEYVIIDEMSMVGLRLLGKLSTRLNQIFVRSGNRHEDRYFGDRSVILLGDFGQLPPVKDTPLWTPYSGLPNKSCPFLHKGFAAYASFNEGVVLDQVMRQNAAPGASDDDVRKSLAFKSALSHLRLHDLTDEDIDLFSCRLKLAPTPDEIPEILHLYCTNKEAQAHNNYVLSGFRKKTGLPLHTITSLTFPSSLKNASADDAGGLLPSLSLIVGARVMLTTNINVEYGLVNGSIGQVMGIGPKGAHGHPSAIMVEFSGYTGPTHPLAQGCVGIIPVSREFSVGSTHGSRTMFPLKLSWACTVHKSQGITVTRVVVNISGPKIMDIPTLAFVGFSRVKDIEGLYIQSQAKLCVKNPEKRAFLTNEELRISGLGIRLY